jgi:transposase
LKAFETPPRTGRLFLWTTLIVRWVTALSPRDFGFLRSRWTCALIALLLWEQQSVSVSAETVRRCLHQEELVWRRPRPTVARSDPSYYRKMRHLRELLAHLPANETAVFQDEVDVNTNPEIGAMWMRRGQQAEIATPGTNTKRYVAGSLHWRTGTMLFVAGSRRNAKLFLDHLDHLRRSLRHYRRIHVICDNARFHNPLKSKEVQAYLAKWGHRIELHYLPRYSPKTNPIERVWWHLRDEITRNHRCGTIEELLDLVFAWLQGEPFAIETSLYPRPADVA